MYFTFKWPDPLWVDSYDIVNPKEPRACTCVSWCIAFDTKWEVSNKYLESHGKIEGRGMTLKAIESAMNGLRGYKATRLEYTKTNKISLKKFIELHKEGVYYVAVSKHALVVKDSVVYDWKYAPLRRVEAAWKIERI